MRIFREMGLIFLLGIFLPSCRSSVGSTNSTISHNKIIQEKYADLLGVDKSQVVNFALYSFVDTWIGTPYKYAGKGLSGVDCSGFTTQLEKEVFGKEVSGPSWSLFENCKKIAVDDLQEGDLVFFKIESDKISHVGVYLQNKKFVHASVSKGVVISSLDENYYKKYYHSGGRPR